MLFGCQLLQSRYLSHCSRKGLLAVFEQREGCRIGHSCPDERRLRDIKQTANLLQSALVDVQCRLQSSVLLDIEQGTTYANTPGSRRKAADAAFRHNLQRKERVN